MLNKRIKINYKSKRVEYLTKAHETDSGYDLKATKDYILNVGETKKISTGIYMELPQNLEVQVRPKSSISENGILTHFGTVDSGYRGEIQVVLTNLSNKVFEISKGRKIAQIVFSKILDINLVKVEKIEENIDRGIIGFGSTGKF